MLQGCCGDWILNTCKAFLKLCLAYSKPCVSCYWRPWGILHCSQVLLSEHWRGQVGWEADKDKCLEGHHIIHWKILFWICPSLKGPGGTHLPLLTHYLPQDNDMNEGQKWTTFKEAKKCSALLFWYQKRYHTNTNPVCLLLPFLKVRKVQSL